MLRLKLFDEAFKKLYTIIISNDNTADELLCKPQEITFVVYSGRKFIFLMLFYINT